MVACAALFLCTAPGRINFPDDEIVFQTTASLVEHRSLAIAGIPKRTGEPKGQPDGTFGWAEGPGGARYGFFGHGLSLVAVPAYALARATAPVVPFAWTRAPRADHYTFHVREARADWTRMIVSLTHCFTTAATAWVLVRWLAWLGLSARAALWSGVAYATATSAWPYTRTFLSEPLSALVLMLAALWIAQAHVLRVADPGKADRRLWLAGAAAGFSIHVHVLNVVAWPCLLAYALAPGWAAGSGGQGRWDRIARACREELGRARGGWVGALALAGLGLGLLLVGQWWRFGDPLETGRHGLYSAWTSLWTGLWAQLAAPGRSFWLYSPAAALGLIGAGAALRGMSWGTGETRGEARPASGGAAKGWPIAAAAWFALALLVTRWLFVSARTDWFGGWGLGPRYLVPAIPAVMIGFAAAVEGLPRWGTRARRSFWVALAGGVALTGYLATHSIFEWMSAVLSDPRVEGRSYMAASHFEWWASPIAGFSTLQPDVLALGALKLARVGHPGPAMVFAGIAAVGLAAWIAVARVLWRLRDRAGP